MRIKLVSGFVYTAVGAGALSLIAGPLRRSLHAIVAERSYEPELAWPWLWVALGTAACLLVASVVRRLAGGERAGLARYAGLLGVAFLSLAARRTTAPPDRPSAREGLERIVSLAERAANGAYTRDHGYPTEPGALRLELPDGLRDFGFRRRAALPIESRVSLAERTSAVVDPVGREPGEVVVAIDAEGRHCWITAFTLDGTGAVAPLADATGRPVVAVSVDGLARHRADPAFPEYPRTR